MDFTTLARLGLGCRSSTPSFCGLIHRTASEDYLKLKMYKGFEIMYELSKVIVRIEGKTVTITATELKNNLSKYLTLSITEDVYITRNGKIVSKLTNPYQDRVAIVKSLFGVLPDGITLEEAKEERLNKI